MKNHLKFLMLLTFLLYNVCLTFFVISQVKIISSISFLLMIICFITLNVLINKLSNKSILINHDSDKLSTSLGINLDDFNKNKKVLTESIMIYNKEYNTLPKPSYISHMLNKYFTYEEILLLATNQSLSNMKFVCKEDEKVVEKTYYELRDK